MIIFHTLYCTYCREIYGTMTWPYIAYVIQGVNPQYSISLKEWFLKVGILDSISEKLIANLQKFRQKAIRPIPGRKPLKINEN